MISRIHFIRHGITEGILNRWYYGATDMPLVQEGIDEVLEYKSNNIYPLDIVDNAEFYTSGMLRAEQTLDVIYGNVPRKSITNLSEMSFGRWECKTFDELKLEPEFDEWMNCTDNSFVFPEGDSIISFYERVEKGFDELLGLHRLSELSHRHSGKDTTSVIVCHGGVISACMERFFAGDRENFWQWIPAPGRGFTLYLEDGKPVKYKEI
ncbi:MAG: histidine phosphatase family protein [Firmicutes bacterium]|nr:histidine phosphatase family protein [Bacillota bacterium]